MALAVCLVLFMLGLSTCNYYYDGPVPVAIYIQSEDSLIIHCPQDYFSKAYWDLADQDCGTRNNQPISFTTSGDVLLNAMWVVKGSKWQKYLYCDVERVTHNADVKVMLVHLDKTSEEIENIGWPVEDRAVSDSIYTAMESDYVKKNFSGAVTIPVNCEEMRIEIMHRVK